MAVEVVQRERRGPGQARRAVTATAAAVRSGGWALLRRKRLPWAGLRQYLLAVTGLAMITVGAFHVAAWLGWMVGGVAALVLEWRIQEE